jgi:8-hydroxy-5-deazaflavin:NADPH oxidoreductase
MRIGIIGSGNIGATAARLFTAAGHEVAISNSRGPESLAGLVAEIGPNLRATTVAEAADFGEVVLEAIPFGRYTVLPADRLAGKVVVLAGNYYPGRDGEIDLHGGTQAELVATHLTGARIVKAFNTIYFQHLADQGRVDLPSDERRAIFVAGDDADAIALVSELIDQIGFTAVTTGTLAESARQEPGAPIYNQQLTGAEARQQLRNT